jgi:hypothetical protein
MTMKKIYNAPNTIVVKIRPNHLMQASQGNLSTMESDQIGNSSDFGARGGSSLWDDDEEDY